MERNNQAFVLDIYGFFAKLSLTGGKILALVQNEGVKRRNAMTRYEQDNLETARRCDNMIREIEQADPNVLSSVVPESRLHSIIHNPVIEGIDEG